MAPETKSKIPSGDGVRSGHSLDTRTTSLGTYARKENNEKSHEYCKEGADEGRKIVEKKEKESLTAYRGRKRECVQQEQDEAEGKHIGRSE